MKSDPLPYLEVMADDNVRVDLYDYVSTLEVNVMSCTVYFFTWYFFTLEVFNLFKTLLTI